MSVILQFWNIQKNEPWCALCNSLSVAVFAVFHMTSEEIQACLESPGDCTALWKLRWLHSLTYPWNDFIFLSVEPIHARFIYKNTETRVIVSLEFPRQFSLIVLIHFKYMFSTHNDSLGVQICIRSRVNADWAYVYLVWLDSVTSCLQSKRA